MSNYKSQKQQQLVHQEYRQQQYNDNTSNDNICIDCYVTMKITIYKRKPWNAIKKGRKAPATSLPKFVAQLSLLLTQENITVLIRENTKQQQRQNISRRNIYNIFIYYIGNYITQYLTILKRNTSAA